ncbi:MAG: hypothetical protein Q7S88_00125 [Candidatus Daviesbacteria bacterium]|nr:hypothetical protein [Candidatus Daviesbacteria bacterium]
MSYFYSHIIEIESVIIKLDELNLDESQKKHLASLLDSIIHHEILNLVLSKLTDSEKSVFIRKMQENPKNRELLNFLNDKSSGIEKEIKTAASDIIKDFHKDIEEAHREAKGSLK